MGWEAAWQKAMGGDEPPEMGQTRLSEPTQITLADGSPLYHVLIDQGKLVATAADTNAAKQELQDLFNLDPEKVRSCQGKTQQQALAVLDSIESRPAAPQPISEASGPQVAA